MKVPSLRSRILLGALAPLALSAGGAITAHAHSLAYLQGLPKVDLAHMTAQNTLDRIEELISVEGDTPETQVKIGKLLTALIDDPLFRYDVGAMRDVRGTASWTIAAHDSGSVITTWEHTKPGSDDVKVYAYDNHPGVVHYHGQWEVIAVMPNGTWVDGFWQAIPMSEQPYKPGKKTVKFKTHSEIHPGEVMIMDPLEPHGFRKGEQREVRGIQVVYIGAHRGEGRRMNLDVDTGMATVAKVIERPKPAR